MSSNINHNNSDRGKYHNCDSGEGRYFVSGCKQQKSPFVDLNIGQTLLEDRFTIERRLGSGSMSTVYLASDALRQEIVALKIIDVGPFGNNLLESQLRKEVQFHSRINDYQNIVKVFDIHFDSFKASRLLIMSMEYADGGTFRQWLLKNTADIQTRQSKGVSLIKQACHGIKFAA